MPPHFKNKKIVIQSKRSLRREGPVYFGSSRLRRELRCFRGQFGLARNLTAQPANDSMA
jgi:hypothetical protein